MELSVHQKVEAVAQSVWTLRRLAPIFETLDQEIADRYGIARSDVRCLEVLNMSGGLTAGDLAAAVGLSATALSTALQRLEAKRLIARSHPAANRRQVLVEITEAGRTIAIIGFGRFVRAAAALLASYTIAEVELVTRFLSDLRAPLLAKVEEEREDEES